VNTGGGGGGGGFNAGNNNRGPGGNGGKGVVIVRYITTDIAAQGLASVTGGTITTSGDYTIHTFNDTGSLVVA
jgi:hypothetical protein